jgi:hypothetical protein
MSKCQGRAGGHDRQQPAELGEQRQARQRTGPRVAPPGRDGAAIVRDEDTQARRAEHAEGHLVAGHRADEYLNRKEGDRTEAHQRQGRALGRHLPDQPGGEERRDQAGGTSEQRKSAHQRLPTAELGESPTERVVERRVEVGPALVGPGQAAIEVQEEHVGDVPPGVVAPHERPRDRVPEPHADGRDDHRQPGQGQPGMPSPQGSTAGSRARARASAASRARRT